MSNFIRVLSLLGVMGLIVYALLSPLFSFVLSGLTNFGYMLEQLI